MIYLVWMVLVRLYAIPNCDGCAQLERIAAQLNGFVAAAGIRVAPFDHSTAYESVEAVLVRSNLRAPFASQELAERFIMPPLWSYRMCLVRGTSLYRVESPKDLQGCVHLDSPERARSYLRSFTQIYAIRLFPHYHYVEVNEVPDEEGVFAHGSLAELNARTGMKVSDETTEQAGGFVVTRCLIEYRNLQPTTVHGVVERVSRSGQYEFLAMTSVPFEDIKSMISLPKARVPM